MKRLYFTVDKEILEKTGYVIDPKISQKWNNHKTQNLKSNQIIRDGTKYSLFQHFYSKIILLMYSTMYQLIQCLVLQTMRI